AGEEPVLTNARSSTESAVIRGSTRRRSVRRRVRFDLRLEPVAKLRGLRREAAVRHGIEVLADLQDERGESLRADQRHQPMCLVDVRVDRGPRKSRLELGAV